MSRGNPSPSKDAGLRDRGRGGTNTNNATNNSADLPRIPSILATSTFSSNRDGHRMSMRTPVFDTPSASTTDSSVAPERIDMGRTVRQSSVVQLPPDNLQPATSAVTAPAAAAAAATSTFVASISGEEMPPPPPQASNTGPLSRPEGVSFTRDEDGAEDGGEVPTIPRFFFFPTFSGAHQGLGASSSTLISGVGRASGLVHVSPTASPGGGGGAAAASTAAAAGSTSGGGAGANIPNPPANWAAATAAGHGHGLAPRALGAVNVSSPTGRSPTAVKFTTGGPLHPPPYPSSLSLDGVGHVLTGGGGRGDGDGDADDEFGSVEDTSSLFGSLAVPEAASSLTGRGAAAAAHAHHPFPMADGGAADHGTGLGNTSLYGPDSSTITATNALNARHRTFSDAALKDILFFLSEVGKEAENMSLQLLIDHGEFYLLSTQSHNNVDGSPEASPTRPPAMVHQQPTNELSVSSEVLLDRPTTQRGSQRHRASSIAQPSMLPHPESSTSISESLYAPSPEFTFSMTRRATGHALNLSHESLVHHARPSRNRMSIKAASAANEEEEEGDGAEEGLAPAPAFPLFESCNAFNYSEEWFSELGRAIISPNTAHPRSGAKMALVAVTADAPLFFSGMLHDPITNRFLLGGTAFTEEARVLRVVLSSNTRQDGAAAGEGLSPMNRGGGSARARYAKLLLREYVSISKVNEGCIVQTFSVLPNDVAINPNKHATVPPKIVRMLVNQTEAGALTRAFSLHGVCRRRPVQEKTPAEVVVTLPRALSNPPAVAGRRIDSLTRPGDAPLAGPLERNSLMSVESSFASGGTLVEELTSPFTHVVVAASGSGTTITNGGGSRRISLRRAPSPLDRVVSPNARALYGATPITQGSSSTASVPFTGVLAMRRRTREALGTELYLREENPTLFQWVVERDPAHFVEPIDNIRTYLTHYKQVTSVRMAVKALFFSARRIQRFLRYCIAKKRRALMRMLRLWRQLEIEAKLKLQHYTPAPSSIERIDMIAGTVLQEHMITTKDYKIAVIQEMWEIRRSSYRKWRRERQVDALLRRQDWKSAAVELPSTLQSDDDWSRTSRPSICTTRSNETAVPHLDCLVLDAAREAVKDQEKPVAVTTSPELRAAARQLRQGLERHSLFGWYMEPETLLYESHRRLLLTLKSSVLTMEQVQYEVQRESAEAARQRAKASSPTSRMTPRKPEGAMMGGGLQSVAGYTRGTSMSVGSRRSVMRRADAGK